MSIIKPYTFKGGEKARASEVNENFDVLYTEVNKNISSISGIENNVSNLELTKANVNGSTNNVFKVRDPVTPNDAVNKQTLFNKIGNSINLISGLLISKDTAKTNGIIVHPGKCYDSTGEYVLSLSNITYKENNNQNANLRYNVFITSSNDGISSDIIILVEGQTPSNSYRLIGYFYTDSNNKIVRPTSFGTDENCNELVKIEPDWSYTPIDVSVSTTNNWKAPCNGWICVGATNTTWRVDGNVPYNLLSFISSGSILTGTSSTVANLKFIPCKGN